MLKNKKAHSYSTHSHCSDMNFGAVNGLISQQAHLSISASAVLYQETKVVFCNAVEAFFA